jgi:AraC-like DNA-binding protein
MFRYFQDHAQAELASLGRPEQFTDRVRATIFAAIEASGEPSSDTVARSLGMSGRTLRRRLERDGRSFRELLDQTRMAAADRMLLDPERTISQIASALGFAEASSFSRCYRRLRRMTPREHRLGRRSRS